MQQHQAESGVESASGFGRKTLAETAYEEGRRLASDPNICGVGYGIKLRKGMPDGEHSACIVYFVREKLATAETIAERGSYPILSKTGEFPTDVVEIGCLAAAAADRAVPAGRRGALVAAPLVGGTATMGLGTQAAGAGGYGTIGGLCFDSATNVPLLLSNAHVWGQTVGTEVTQPVMTSALFGAAVSPATAGTPSAMVLTRIPAGLTAPVVFANAVAQTYLIEGSNADPLVFGQGATPVPVATRTNNELVKIGASSVGLAPAGRRLSPAPSWNYQRFSSSAVLAASSTAARPVTNVLTARRLFTNAASCSSGQVVNLYAEIIPATGGIAAVASSHYPLVLLYPWPAGGTAIPRMLRPTSRQTPTTVVTQFTGFPAPARVGVVRLPLVVASVFAVDADGTGLFQTANAGTLPAGTLALKLPVGTVRVFVPPSTQVILDLDLRGAAGTLGIQGVSSAGDNVGTNSVPSPGASGRTLVTIDASELVEVDLTIAGTVVLYGITSRRGSPESTSPLAYSGTVNASDLLPKGKWGASLFVQGTDSGITESANVVETAIGAASLVCDCTFTVV